MSLPKTPKSAKLVISLIVRDQSLVSSVTADLAERFGGIDMVSAWFPFDFTAYYEPEMGSPLYRRLVTFHTLIDQDALADIKCLTNGIENTYSEGRKRRVNLDPGYLIHERFVLATGKNYTHRIYIGKGIYADLTLVFQKGAFTSLPWTYPDYSHTHVRSFLENVRRKYVFDLNRSDR